MRCSICMSQLIEKDDAVVCPNCQSIHGAEPIPAYQSDFDDNIEKPDSLATTMFRSTLWVLGVVFLVALGGVGGWTLRGSVTGLDDISLVRVASSAFDQNDARQRDDVSTSVDPNTLSFERFLFAPNPKQGNLTVVGVGAENGTYRFQATASGSAEAANLLEAGSQISPIAAAQLENRTLALFGHAGEDSFIMAWSPDGVLLWQTKLNLDTEPSGAAKLQALGTGFVLVTQDSLTNQAVAHKVSKDGGILWKMNLGHSAADHLSIYGSPFDELVVISKASSESRDLRVQSLTPEGISGFSANFQLRDNEQILAATVDSIGQIQILLSGAPPRLLTQDALGRTAQSRSLSALLAIPQQTPCLLESRSQRLRVACTQNDVLQDSVLNLTTSEPEVEIRRSEPLEQRVKLITIYDDSALAIEGRATGVFSARSISLNAIPEPGDVSIPGDAAIALP